MVVENQTLKPFTTIKYTTKDGENCTATKDNGIVTVVGDKNGVRQVQLDEFMKNLAAELPKTNLEKTPDKDTVTFSGKEDNKNLMSKNKMAMLATAGLALLGAGIYFFTRGRSSSILEKSGRQITEDLGQKAQKAQKAVIDAVDDMNVETVIPEVLPANTVAGMHLPDGAFVSPKTANNQQRDFFSELMAGMAGRSGKANDVNKTIILEEDTSAVNKSLNESFENLQEEINRTRKKEEQQITQQVTDDAITAAILMEDAFKGAAKVEPKAADFVEDILSDKPVQDIFAQEINYKPFSVDEFNVSNDFMADDFIPKVDDIFPDITGDGFGSGFIDGIIDTVSDIF